MTIFFFKNDEIDQQNDEKTKKNDGFSIAVY